MSKNEIAPGQLGFDDLLASAEADNAARKFDRETTHLPGTMDEALPYLRELLERHHAAMLAADVDQTMRLRDEADLLAKKLDSENRGILAHENAPGNVLERETAAPQGTVPLWGQSGLFTVAACGMTVRIEPNGVFGIASGFCYWPGFSAHAVDWDRPFLSKTGYRSFLGVHADPAAGVAPDVFAVRFIEDYVRRELGGKPVGISADHRERAREFGEV